jgi:hypothetical protein
MLIMPFISGQDIDVKRKDLKDADLQELDNAVTYETLIGECIVGNNDPHSHNIRVTDEGDIYVIDFDSGLYDDNPKYRAPDPVLMLKTMLARQNARTIINHFDLGQSFPHYQNANLNRGHLLESLQYHKDFFHENKIHVTDSKILEQSYSARIIERIEKLEHYLAKEPDGPGMI